MLFLLDIESDPAARRATLRLSDEHGVHLAAREVTVGTPAPALWAGLFDPRGHLARLKGTRPPEELLAELGRFLGEHVLGKQIAAKLAEGPGARAVLVRLGDPAHDDLAASFAQVPWEIARAPGEARTLLEGNVVVRAAPAGTAPGREVSVEDDKPVRVLLVFAEAPGTRLLGARLERERLLALFHDDVLPKKQVEVDVLCHGVTRRRLTEQVRARGGYHVVHWSGHGHMGGLALADDDDLQGAGVISSKELVELFDHAGGFIPHVMFLGACESGALPVSGASPALTGTALALVRAGVKQVVAMRWDVGDRYARRLARRFYRGLLVEPAHHATDVALALARTELLRDEKRKAEYDAVDHANAMIFGADRVRLVPRSGASAQMRRRQPRPQPLLQSGSKELDPPHGFVGRGEELTRLARGWLDREGAPVALIQGLAGLGKTSLAAEAIHLWFDRFDYVFCFAAKGGVLSNEEFYRRLDLQLTRASPVYRDLCSQNEMARIYLQPGQALMGELREETLRNNLIDVLGTERILLVLDNFETNLLSAGSADGYASQDPAWDRLLLALSDRLRGTGSRLMVTSRHRLTALARPELAVWISLGPLPIGEAVLFFEGQPSIRALLFGDEEDRRLAWRILDVSRGHPLILGRLADLARAYLDKKLGLTAAGRKALAEALDKIRGHGYQAVPEAFAGAKADRERDAERRYLEDVAIGAVELLIERLHQKARELLWVVTRAEAPVAANMIADVFGEPVSELLGVLCSSGLLVRDGENYAFHELVAECATAWMEAHSDERGGRTETEVWREYGKRYGALFKTLRTDAKRDLASEMGRRGIQYLVRARAFDDLGAFASHVVMGTHDPVLLGQVIADFQAAAGEVPAGQARWRLQTYLAAALRLFGRPDQALPLYTQAAGEAEAAEHWRDLGWIYANWAIALVNVVQLDRAREMHMKSAAMTRSAGGSRADIMIMENEALRVDVMQGRAAEARPVIDAKLGEVRAWWALSQQGKPIPEAPDAEVLAITMVGGLEVALLANLGLERWQSCLDLLGEIEHVQRALGTGEHDVARVRFSRYQPLMKLGMLAEARAVLEGCLGIYHRVGDVTEEARALSALANVWSELGDSGQAIALARRALAVRERLPDPRDRANSHEGLAIYLHATGATAEATPHRLAALVYYLVTGLDPRPSLHNLAILIRQSAARGETFTLPRLADLLSTPTFAPLLTFLTERGVSTDDLQARIDALVEQARTIEPT